MSRLAHASRRLNLEPLEDRIVMDTYTVTRLSDTGAGRGLRGDLRYCLTQANATPGEDLIIFSTTGTINLTKALPSISDHLIIAGPGQEELTVRRDTGGAYRILNILVGVNVQIYSITIANGSASGGAPKDKWGGGIYNSGNLTLGASRVVGNFAGGSSGVATRGGGVFNDGNMTIYDSTIANNTNHNSLAQGEASAQGGGILNHEIGTMSILNSTIRNNLVTTTSFEAPGADGAGINNRGSLLIANSTVANNAATGGSPTAGGIWGNAIITSCTIYGNSAFRGGGVYGQGASLRNTIVAANSASFGPDIWGSILSNGHNLIGNTSGGSGFVATDILNVDPLLGPLADNGGPTFTMALLPGSPAIDAGDNTDAPEWDQRGPGFPRIVNGTIDIGAFEVQATNAPGMTGDLTVLMTADFGDFTFKRTRKR